MSMMKKHFEVRRDIAKVEKIKKVEGLEPWGDTNETNSSDGLIPWGTEAEQEIARQALVNHFAR